MRRWPPHVPGTRGARRPEAVLVPAGAARRAARPTVVVTAALVLLESGSGVAQWLARLLGAELSALVEETMLLFPDQGALGIASLFSAVLVLLMIGVLRRSRWARIALMGLFMAD